jgi:hypothetical protein
MAGHRFNSVVAKAIDYHARVRNPGLHNFFLMLLYTILLLDEKDCRYCFIILFIFVYLVPDCRQTNETVLFYGFCRQIDFDIVSRCGL